MKLRSALGWVTAGVTLYVAAAYAQAPASAPSAVPAAIDELWTMAKAAGILGTAVLLITLRYKQKDLDEAKAEIKVLQKENKALHERYLEDAALTRGLVQDMEGTTSTLVAAIAKALAVGVQDRKDFNDRHTREGS